MIEKETLRIVLTEDQQLELEFECTLETFTTVIVTAIKEAESLMKKNRLSKSHSDTLD